MTAKGHMLLASNITFSTFIIFPETFGFINSLPVFIGAVLLGSLFPDVDEKGSSINRKVPLLLPISYLFKHRSITHFFISFLAFLTIALVIDEVYRDFFLGFAFGWLFHTVGDLLTIAGIKGYFFPFFFEKRFHLLPKILRFRTGGLVENILIFLLSLTLLYEINTLFL